MSGPGVVFEQSGSESESSAISRYAAPLGFLSVSASSEAMSLSSAMSSGICGLDELPPLQLAKSNSDGRMNCLEMKYCSVR